MDIETTAAIDRLNEGMTSLRADVTGLRADVTDLRADVTDLRVEMREGFADVREGLEEGKRHSRLLFEDLKDDIRILAEGLASLSTRRDDSRR